jgi:hypothetical protein
MAFGEGLTIEGMMVWQQERDQTVRREVKKKGEGPVLTFIKTLT